MRQRKYVAALAALLLNLSLFIGCGHAKQELVILTEEFPPYNYTEGGLPKGISTEVLQLVLKDAGFDVPASSFQFMPWARAYNEVLKRPNTLLYSITRTPERENLFKWVGPIAPNRNVLLARRDRGISIKVFSDALHFKTGAIRDDAGEQLLLAKGYPKERLDIAINAQSNLLKLESGRIDLFAYPETVFTWVALQSGKKPDDYQTVFVLHDGFVYFAVNKATPDEVVSRLQRSLDRLKEAGTVQAIIERYQH